MTGKSLQQIDTLAQLEADAKARRLASLTAARARAQNRLDAADAAWREAIGAALEAGLSTRQVGAKAGISHVRVQAIVKDQRAQDAPAYGPCPTCGLEHYGPCEAR